MMGHKNVVEHDRFASGSLKAQREPIILDAAVRFLNEKKYGGQCPICRRSLAAEQQPLRVLATASEGPFA